MRFRPPALPPIVAGMFTAAALAVGGPAAAAVPIVGHWLTEDGNAVIAVAPCGRVLCGHVERVVKSPPGAAKTDSHNPDPALRGRPIVGVPILTEFADAGADWRGRIYNPEDGRTYKSIVTHETNGTLKVKGCISFFCRAQTWSPAK